MSSLHFRLICLKKACHRLYVTNIVCEAKFVVKEILLTKKAAAYHRKPLCFILLMNFYNISFMP